MIKYIYNKKGEYNDKTKKTKKEKNNEIIIIFNYNMWMFYFL